MDRNKVKNKQLRIYTYWQSENRKKEKKNETFHHASFEKDIHDMIYDKSEKGENIISPLIVRTK